MSPLIQNVLILLGVLAIGGLGYYLYVSASPAVDAENEQVAQQLAAESAEFLRLLNELKAIQLDGSIFSDPRFSSLVDHTTPVEVSPVGRSNPFEISY